MSHSTEVSIVIGLDSFNLHFGARDIAEVLFVKTNCTKVFKDNDALSALETIKQEVSKGRKKLLEGMIEDAEFTASYYGDVKGWCTVKVSHYD